MCDVRLRDTCNATVVFWNIETKNLSTNYIDFFSLQLLNKKYISNIEKKEQSTSSKQVWVIKSLILSRTSLATKKQQKKKKKTNLKLNNFVWDERKIKLSKNNVWYF